MSVVSRRVGVMCVVCVLAGCDGAGPVPTASLEEVPVAPSVVDSPGVALDSLPWPERLRLERAIAADDVRYAPRMDEGGLVLSASDDPGRAIAIFESDGARVPLGDHEVTIAGAAIGREGAMLPMAGSEASARGPEVRRARGTVTEWWRSLPSGLEHGFTVSERPGGEGPLVVETRFEGVRTRTASADAIELLGPDDVLVAAYSHLTVVDADGEGVAARMSGDGELVRIEIDDAAARYPLVVDPLLVATLEATLTLPTPNSNFAFSAVTITSAGDRIAIGQPYENTGGAGAGAAHVFRRSGTAWTVEATLRPADLAAGDSFGQSVAISADGSRLAVSAWNDDTSFGTDKGSVRIFNRSSMTWTEGPVVAFSCSAGTPGIGYRVVLSGDGTQGFVMCRTFVYPFDATTGTPAATGITRTGSTFATNTGGDLLLLDGAIRTRSSGWAVAATLGSSTGGYALTPDGTRALVTSATGVETYLRGGSVSSWSLQASVAGAFSEGAMSGDGTRAILRATGNTSLYGLSGSSWVPSATLGGSGVAISADGARGAAWAGSSYNFSVWSFRAADPNGTACTTGTTCLSGFCVGSGATAVCCDTACTNACEACIVARTGVASGTCSPLSASYAPTITCRAAVAGSGGAATCDLAERCVAGVRTCPADAYSPTTTRCRTADVSATSCTADTYCLGTNPTCPGAPAAPAGAMCAPLTVCTAARFCNGTSTNCPAGTAAPATTVCRAASGVNLCDQAEYCPGTSTTCPADTNWAAGHECRPSAGACDPAELCSGASSACPPNGFSPNGQVCGAASGSCATPGTCNGISASCTSGGVLPVNTVCRASAPGNPCDVDDLCDGLTDVCREAYAAASTACGPAPSGTCDAPDHCAGDAPSCVPTYLAGTACRPAAGTCDIPEACTGASAMCPPDGLLSAGVICREAAGACDSAETCTGGPACPLDVFRPSSVVCRVSAGGCDLVETCTGGDALCPVDGFAPPTTTCRPQTTPCDVGDHCPGSGPDCGPDDVAIAGTVCNGFLLGPCDAQDVCNGVDNSCQDRFRADVECRPAAGACDIAETCTGGSASCPLDVLVSSGVECGGATGGGCSTPGTCNGTIATCPGARPLAAGTICLAADPGNPCDVDDVCDGSSDACRASYASVATSCGAPIAGVCDAPDHCAGTSADCVAEFLSGVECRASGGACDPAEACLGDSPDCAPDLTSPSGTVCRASVETTCDPAESCDGVGGACPADVNACMATTDAGVVDGGAGADGGTRADAAIADGATADPDGGAAVPDGGAIAVVAGCACRAHGPSGAPLPLGVALALAAVVLRRRRAR